jgi:hypothetical protein
MTASEFLRIMRRHWLLLALVPVTTALSIYFFSRFQDKTYKSDTVIYTGIASGYKIEGGNNDTGGNWNATSTAFDNLLPGAWLPAPRKPEASLGWKATTPDLCSGFSATHKLPAKTRFCLLPCANA